MAAKALIPNQHVPLHFLYTQHNCCLCNAEVERDLLKEDIKFLLEFVDEDFVVKDYPHFKHRMEQIRQRVK